MELFKLLGTIVINNSDANQEIAETTEAAEKSGSKLSAALKNIGGIVGKAGQVVGAGLAAGGAAVGAIAKQALGSYAEYEQLVGGVETLFKDNAGKVQEYANNAYKTAGMSANQYMETVTSFSASLLQSLNGDTAKAAEVADQAITDMSDNANKMGSDISMIQNAYQGFAKQNYTMLDNLKLGYGGTKEEMQRLLEDAEKLSGQKFDLSSYADIVEAIHVVQTEMGITGTTAREASSTIEGSLAATKASWQNLLTGMASGEQDMGVLVSNLVNNATTALQNILPRIQQIMGGVVELVTQIAPVIATELPVMLEQMLPGLIEAAATLIAGLVAALPQLLQVLIAQAPFIISQIGAALRTAFPALLVTIAQLLQQITDYLTGVFSPIFSAAFAGLVEIIGKIWNGVIAIIKAPINTVIGLINNFIGSLNKIKIPDWVPGVGGKSINISPIPKLEKGGILKKGQMGFLEGNGAEAVVPLDQNRAWISAVAKDMDSSMGSKETVSILNKILEAINHTNDGQEEMKDSFAQMKFNINNREFARLVKAVN